MLKGMNWGVNVSMMFSGMEIVVMVVDKDDFKKVVLIIVDFFGWFKNFLCFIFYM